MHYLESETVKPMSTAQALARVLELNLTQDCYLKLRKDAIDAGADIWPPYTQVQELKKLCLPRDILYKDSEVVVTLQVGSIILISNITYITTIGYSLGHC